MRRIILIRHGCFVCWETDKAFSPEIQERIRRTALSIDECIVLGLINPASSLFLTSSREDAVMTAKIISRKIGIQFESNELLTRSNPSRDCQEIILPLEKEGKIETLILVGHAETVEGIPNWYYYEKEGDDVLIGVDSWHGYGYLFDIERQIVGMLTVPLE